MYEADDRTMAQGTVVFTLEPSGYGREARISTYNIQRNADATLGIPRPHHLLQACSTAVLRLVYRYERAIGSMVTRELMRFYPSSMPSAPAEQVNYR